ncbi:MAG TPA: hypothetical protein VMH86_04130 [Rhizomicrobium sp.]|nr:hypothetical protein [Rhizomicrobium sp.]
MTRAAKKKLADQLGATPREIARELRAFSRAARVLSANHPRLIDSHPREWVGIYDGRVCASAKSFKLLVSMLKRQGYPPENTIIRYIDTSGRKMIL